MCSLCHVKWAETIGASKWRMLEVCAGGEGGGGASDSRQVKVRTIPGPHSASDEGQVGLRY